MLLRRTTLIPAAALLVLAATLWSARCEARPPIFADPASIQRSDELLRQGNALSRAGKLPEALEAYAAAWALHEAYPIAANLGNLEMNLEKYRDAAEHLGLAVRWFPREVKPAVREALKKSLDEVRQQVGTLRLRIPDGAQVSVDGTAIDMFDLRDELFVDPGHHVLEASQPGYRTDRKELQIVKGETQEVQFVIVSSPAPVSRVDAASALPAPAPPPDSTAPASRSRVPVIVGASLVGVGVAVGTGFAVAASHEGDAALVVHDQLLAAPRGLPCPGKTEPTVSQCSDLKSKALAHDHFVGVARAAFISAGVLAAATAVYLLWPSEKQRVVARVYLAPNVGPQGGGLIVVGEF